MKIATLRLQAIGVSLCVFGAAGAHAHGVQTKTIEIVHPWTYETAGIFEPTMLVYAKIKTRSRQSDQLLGAETIIATAVELSDVPRTGSGWSQRGASLEIKAGQDVELSPSGYSLKLTGVKKAFSAYDTFPLTLVFARAGRIEVEVLVEEGSAAVPHKH